MKAKVHDRVETLVDVKSGFSDRIIPRGTRGVVIERYSEPKEGYAVDLAIPDASLVGGFAYDNVILYPHQFKVIESSTSS